MADQSPRDLEWPTRRWLMWGLLAIVALAVVIGFFVWLGDEEEAADTTVPVGEQLSWSIELVDLTGDTVTLKGDLPLGFPTETWQNDFQVARSVNASFEWDLEQELPVAVVAIDEAADCEALNVVLADILADANDAEEPGVWQARAFAQHAVNVGRDQGCTLDEDMLESVSGL
jgi:hypothetical protein